VPKAGVQPGRKKLRCLLTYCVHVHKASSTALAFTAKCLTGRSSFYSDVNIASNDIFNAEELLFGKLWATLSFWLGMLPYYSNAFFLQKINAFVFNCCGVQARYERIDPVTKFDIGFDVVFYKKATGLYPAVMAKSDELSEQDYWGDWLW
jgi:hypothetical protein